MNKAILRPIWVIGKSSFKEVIRDRLLFGILIAALLVTAASFFLGTISLGQDSRIIQNVGLASIEAFTVFICIFVTSNSVYRDMERRALYLLLPKPISRSQYVLGKFAGMVMLALTTLLILGGLFVIGTLFTDKSISLSVPWVLSYFFMEVSLLIAIALLFSSFTAPLNASLYSVAFYIIGNSLPFVREVAAQSTSIVEKRLVDIAYYVLPNLQKFDIRQAVLYNITVSTGQTLSSIAYWILYIGFVLFLTTLVMKKREV